MHIDRLVILLAIMVPAVALASVDPGLTWAYPQAKKHPGEPHRLPGMYHVDGSAVPAMSNEQLAQLGGPVDWFPDRHPPAPQVVMRGRPKGPLACAECHLVDGQGFLGTTNLAGLPASYIVEQVREFRAGRRISSEANRLITGEMIKVAQQVSDEDLRLAADYYGAMPAQHRSKVVEGATVPKTQIDHFGWFYLDPAGGTEPADGRVVEVVTDPRRLLLNDPAAVVTDYVPPGSVAAGALVARRPNAAGQTCAVCHGDTMQGTAIAPPLAGRYASYLARMLWDIKTGARHGPTVALMQPVVASLTPAEITDVSAYLASLDPPSGLPPAFISAAGGQDSAAAGAK